MTKHFTPGSPQQDAPPGLARKTVNRPPGTTEDSNAERHATEGGTKANII
jgi:hypothetical protein